MTHTTATQPTPPTTPGPLPDPTLRIDPTQPTLGPALTYAALSTLLLWLTWLITHIPGHQLLPSTSSPLLSIAILSAVSLLGPSLMGRKSNYLKLLPTAAIAGLTFGLLNTVLVAGFLSKVQGPGASVTDAAPGAQGMTAAATLNLAAFVLATTILFPAVALLASKTTATKPAPIRTINPWHSRLALLCGGATLMLILMGGLTTSAEAGLAVPDATPYTYDSYMFLYPLSLLSHEPRVFLEHAHRLVGSMTGLLVIALTAYTLFTRTPKHLKLLTIAALILVSFQGYLGAKRVSDNVLLMAAVHGILAQLFFAFLLITAALLSPTTRDPANTSTPLPTATRTRKLGIALIITAILQLALGSLYRHYQAKPDFNASHILFTHIGLSLVVTILAAATGFVAASTDRSLSKLASSLSRHGRLLAIFVFIQFALGWAAWAGIITSPSRNITNPQSDQLAQADPVPLFELITTTAHHTNGALFFALAALTLTYALVARPSSQPTSKPPQSPTPTGFDNI